MKNIFRKLEDLWVLVTFAEAGVNITVSDDYNDQLVQESAPAHMS